jgi:hypothetical protein
MAAEDVRIPAEASATPPADPPESPDGLWRGTYECGRNRNTYPFIFTLKPEMHLKGGTGAWYPATPSLTNGQTFGISVSIEGTNVLVTRRVAGGSSTGTTLLGRLEGNSIWAGNNICTIVLVRVASSAVVATAPPTALVNARYDATYSDAASPTLPSPDGSWRGTYRCNASLQTGSLPFVIDLKLHLTNGSATWRSAGPGLINGDSFDVAVSVVRDISSVVRTASRPGSLGSLLGARGNTLTGQYDGATINATGRERSSGRDCTLALTRS